MRMKGHSGMLLAGETEKKNSKRKTCASATLSPTNPTRTDFRSQTSATNRLSHGTVLSNEVNVKITAFWV
jgi:hypothetical protein